MNDTLSPKMKVLVFGSILTLGCLTFAFDPENCGEQQLQLCLTDELFEFRSPQSFFLTKEQLDTRCPPLLNTAECVEDFMDRCLGSLMFGNSTFDELFGRINGLITVICTEGSPYRTEYLQHSPCLLRNIQTLINCYRVQENFDDMMNLMNYDSKTYLCMKLTGAQNCIMVSAGKLCGPGAATVARHLLFIAAQDIIVTCFSFP